MPRNHLMALMASRKLGWFRAKSALCSSGPRAEIAEKSHLEPPDSVAPLGSTVLRNAENGSDGFAQTV
jgi:hypothetical protein